MTPPTLVFDRFGMATVSGEATRCFKLKGNSAGEGRLFYKGFVVSRETKPRPLQINDLWQPPSAEEAEADASFKSLCKRAARTGWR